jgi:hypothetical protein
VPKSLPARANVTEYGNYLFGLARHDELLAPGHPPLTTRRRGVLRGLPPIHAIRGHYPEKTTAAER